MIKKYDWNYLKFEFVSGEWLSLSSFFRSKNIPYNSYTRLKAKRWLRGRDKYQQNIKLKVDERVVENEVKVRLRQLGMAKTMQDRAFKQLKTIKIKRADDARKMLISGMEQERMLLGLNQRRNINPSSLTQVNLTYPRTRIDEMLDQMNIVELLDFIVEIKKEKERRGLENKNLSIT